MKYYLNIHELMLIGRGVAQSTVVDMEYSSVRVGKLRLKGAAGAGLKVKKKRKRKGDEREEVREEDLRHGTCIFPQSRRGLQQVAYSSYTGGWRRVCSQEAMGGRVLLLTCTGGYIQALDSGDFCVGQPRDDGRLNCLVLG